MKTLPKISIVIVTLNNERSINECARCIKMQNYPPGLIEYLNVDGGSTDSTKKILKSYGFKIIDSYIKKNAEAQRAIGVKKAKNNLIVSLDADNYLPNKDWLRQMVKPFIDDPEIVHANTMYYKYRKNDTIYNRYAALFGVIDPIVYYIGKPDRLSQSVKKWTLGNVLSETEDYYVVEFNKSNLPTVGCNGVVYRKDLILKYAKSDPYNFLHIDVFADLLENGFKKYAIVKNEIIHDTAVSLGKLMKKRIAFLSSYYLISNNNKIERRYLIYNPKNIIDNIKLSLFILGTVTFVRSIKDSMKGYLTVRDIAWFMHPYICWVFLFAYSLATIKRIAQKK